MIDWSERTRTLARTDGGEVSWWEVGEGAQTSLSVHGLPLGEALCAAGLSKRMEGASR